jgi:hypothetical protein
MENGVLTDLRMNTSWLTATRAETMPPQSQSVPEEQQSEHNCDVQQIRILYVVDFLWLSIIEPAYQVAYCCIFSLFKQVVNESARQPCFVGYYSTLLHMYGN